MSNTIKYPTLRHNGELQWGNHPTEIILHQTGDYGTPEALNESAITLGQIMSGYNYYVRLDGEIFTLRPINAIGGHCSGHNASSIGIAFEGDFQNKETSMNDEQFNSAIWLCQSLMKENPSIVSIESHDQVDKTVLCPGKNFPLAEMQTTITGQSILPVDTIAINSTPEFKTNNSGAEVLSIKTKLNELGLSLANDSYFDKSVSLAIMDFQKEQSIKIDGIVGVITMAKLITAINDKESKGINEANSNASEQPAETSIDIKSVQTNLNNLFHSNIPVSGEFDKLTNNAVVNFQHVMGLQLNGIFDTVENNVINSIIARPILRLGCNSVYAVKYIQWRLGLNIDGIFGGLMHNAILSFQKTHNLEPDGVLSTTSWDILLKW